MPPELRDQPDADQAYRIRRNVSLRYFPHRDRTPCTTCHHSRHAHHEYFANCYTSGCVCQQFSDSELPVDNHEKSE